MNVSTGGNWISECEFNGELVYHELFKPLHQVDACSLDMFSAISFPHLSQVFMGPIIIWAIAISPSFPSNPAPFSADALLSAPLTYSSSSNASWTTDSPKVSVSSSISD
eukprot:TRINITY_DN557_c0_g3_i1.p1 TRINITY_DN557_c0_g3~~TRINITY_DN557_c0_g3_i1.p1  ORF type:complete len:109 (-),score=5.24 TRINITY_DN557_c0_g3_i1:44-370(-)